MTLWSRIWSFLKFNNPDHKTLFDSVAKGDPNKEKHIVLIFLRVIHTFYFVTIPIAFIALTVILPIKGFIPYADQGKLSFPLILVFTVLFYIISLLFTILFFKWPRNSTWAKYIGTFYLLDLYMPDPQQRLYMNVIMSYILRVNIGIEISVVFAFFLKILGGGWYFVIPLFLLAIILFVLIVPTDHKVSEWVNEQKVNQNQ